jgi:hypothetical protein
VHGVLLACAMLLARGGIAAHLLARPAGGGAWRAACWPGGALPLGDAIQALCVFVLRCYRVAVAPLVAYCVLLWGVGVVGGYLLAYRGLGRLAAQHSPAAFWVASSFALGLLAVILPLILWRACARASGRRDSAAARTRAAGSTIAKVEPCPACCRSQLAAVPLHHVLDDRQAQPGAAGFARAAAVDAVEAFGQPRQVLGAMPGPVSRTAELSRPPAAGPPTSTAPPGACSAPRCSPGWTRRLQLAGRARDASGGAGAKAQLQRLAQRRASDARSCSHCASRLARRSTRRRPAAGCLPAATASAGRAPASACAAPAAPSSAR